MPSPISESDFSKKADDLLKDAGDRAGAIGEGDAFVKDCLKLVDDAKTLHVTGKDPEAYAKYIEALKKIEAAETSIRFEPLAGKLLCLQFVYLVVLLFLAYGTRKWPSFGLWSGLVVHDTQTAWFGALGGVSIGIYGIYDHIRKRDFGPKYYLWYLCKPVIGAIFGWFAYLVISLGLLSTTGVNKISNPQLPFAIAFLAGFSERFTIQLIDKLMSVLLGTPDSKTSEKPKT